MGTDNTFTDILTERREHILRIKINRPQKKNALTIAMYAAMADAIIQADEDGDIRVVFLQGTADCFTAGNDLQDFKDYTPDGEVRPANPFCCPDSSGTSMHPSCCCLASFFQRQKPMRSDW